MCKRPRFSLNNPFIDLLFLFLIGIIIGCSDTVGKSPLSSIPNTEIPTDIIPVSSGGNGLQIKGGSIERNRTILYIRFEEVNYKDCDIWFLISSVDSSYTFQEILNREPNNFINDITYKYIVNHLSSGTEYNAWIVYQYFSEKEEVETNFTTLSE